MVYINALGQTLVQTGAVTNWSTAWLSSVVQYGTAANDLFYVTINATIYGLGGDDTFYVYNPYATIIEPVGSGPSTIWDETWTGMTLPANVANLVLDGPGASFGYGNSGNNLIIAGSTAATLDGMGGNDVLVGGSSADVFQIDAANGGTAAIYNFKPGSDVVSLNGYAFTTFNQVLWATSQSGSDVVITLSPTSKVVLRNTALGSLSAANFRLTLPTIVSTAGRNYSYVNALGQAVPTSATPWIWSGGTTGLRLGSGTPTAFFSYGGDTILGAGADDTLYLWNPQYTAIYEPANAGVVTIHDEAWYGMTLPTNVANLVLAGAGADFGLGNSGNNLITAGVTAALIDGEGGNDVAIAGAGADVFELDAANGGSLAIYNFKLASDQVVLNGFAQSSFAGVLAVSRQLGNDVVIQPSSTGQIVLRGVKLSALTAANFAEVLTTSAPPPGTTLLNGPSSSFNGKGWYVLDNAWNMGDLSWGNGAKANTAAGNQLAIQTTFNPADPVDGVQFSWNAPLTATGPVLAYPDIAWGYGPDAGVGQDPTDPIAVFPFQLSSLVGLTANQTLTLGGNKTGYDVSYDLWFTSVPNGGASTVTNEVMIWLHQGTVTPFGSVIGTYTSPTGATATISHTGTYTAVVFNSDLTSGQLNIGNVFVALENLGILSGSEYMDALFLGAEVVSGAGALNIGHFDFSVATRLANGATLTKAIAGTGTSQTLTNATGTALTLDGSDGGMTVIAGAAGDTLIGGAGDTLVGGTGSDSYQFGVGFGIETVNNFAATGSTADTLVFSSTVFADWAHVLAASRQSGNNVIITADAKDVITLAGVKLASLGSSNALFT